MGTEKKIWRAEDRQKSTPEALDPSNWNRPTDECANVPQWLAAMNAGQLTEREAVLLLVHYSEEQHAQECLFYDEEQREVLTANLDEYVAKNFNEFETGKRVCRAMMRRATANPKRA